MHTIVFSYCQDNEKQAKDLEQQLSVEGLHFEHIVCDQLPEGKNWFDLLEQHKNEPVFMLISDNFLKSQDCMHEAMRVIHYIQDNRNIHPLIIDGVETDQSTGKQIAVPTLFDRVSNVIQYMNFWQERYLEVRKLKRNAKPEDEEEVNKLVSVVRSISTEVGEFLRLLRSTEYILLEQFSADQFAAFFQLAGVPHHLQERFLEKSRQKVAVPIEVEHQVVTKDQLQETTPKQVKPPVRQEIPVLESQEVEPIAPSFQSKLNPESEETIELLQSLFEEDDNEEEVSGNSAKEVSPPSDPIDLDTEEIEIDLSNSSNLDPNELLHQARHYLNEGQTDRAFKVYEDLLKQDPGNINARFLYSTALANQGKNISKAMEHMEMITKYDPKNLGAYKKLADYAESLNDFILAKKYYEKILDIDPKAEGIPYKLGVINLNFFSDKPKIAAKYFKAAIKQNKKHVDAHYQYAIIMSEYLNKYDKAIKHFDKTLELNPRHTFANYDLALLYHKTGKHQMAANYYQRAYSINPELKTEENDAAFFFPFPENESQNLELLSRDVSTPPQESGTSLSEILEEPKPTETIESVPTSSEQLSETQEAPSPKGPQEGKIVWITGATSGIGRATAKVFAENGYSLVITGRRDDRLEELKENFESNFGYEVQTLTFDVRDRKSVKNSINKLPKAWQNCDILINNAGLASGFGPIQEGDIDDWEVMIDTNVKGLLYMTRLISPGMVERRRGHIINIASTAGKEVYPGGNVYCATKFAVEALTKAMRLDLHKYGIKVSQIAPGHVEETEFSVVRFHGDQEKAKIYEDFQPLKSSDVAEALYFVATRPPHVNIQDILMMGTQQASNVFIDRSGRE